MLKNKKILLGISGSIAAYKMPLLVRLLVKAGAEVKVVMTPAARDFVAPLTLSTLSKNEVVTAIATDDAWANHVMLGRWADVFLVAPLSCNTLAKMAHGICDNVLMAVYLSATCPVIIAPAMDEDMWHHPATRKNLSLVQEYGNTVVPVESGELASGLNGEGRMAEPETLFNAVVAYCTNTQSLKGKKALVTAGPTYEALDPVRFIGNHSSGKMGIALAEELAGRGADVTLVLGPSSLKPTAAIHTIKVLSAAEMLQACTGEFAEADICIMSAAVADYTPVNRATEKIKKQADSFSIELTKTTDILKELGKRKKEGQLLIGFALETTNERAYALKKLSDKNADMIVLNSLNDQGAGFGHDTNKITIFDKYGNEYPFETKSKREVAADIINTIIQYNK